MVVCFPPPWVEYGLLAWHALRLNGQHLVYAKVFVICFISLLLLQGFHLSLNWPFNKLQEGLTAEERAKKEPDDWERMQVFLFVPEVDFGYLALCSA